MDTTLELTKKDYTIAAVEGLQVTRVIFFADDTHDISSLPRTGSKLAMQLDLKFRGRKVEYHSPVDRYDLKRLLADGVVGIATRFGRARAKPRGVVITLGPKARVWVDRMLEQGAINAG